MEDAPEIAPIRYQIDRERRCEREQLSEQLTTLKSLLRLEADGIGDREDLFDALEKTRQTIERFSITLRRESLNLDIGCTDVTPPHADPFDFEAPASPNPFDSPCPAPAEEEGSVDGNRNPRLSFSGSSSTQSSWRSSSSTISTTATSISPRDSLVSRRFAPSPVSVFPSPYLGRLREEEFRFGDEADGFVEEEGDDAETPDASFERLSTILASLQRQAEAAVFSPTIDEEDSPANFWGDGGGDLSPTSTRTITCRRTVRSAPGTPGLTPILTSLASSAVSPAISPSHFPRPPLDAKLGVPDQLLPPFSPELPPNLSSCPATPGITRRRTGKSVPESEEGTKWEDFEGILAEFLDERIFGRYGEQQRQDVMFRWVWVYILSGGLVWAAVGWFLKWGCSACEGSSSACAQ
jgi:hypothetical protein